MQGAESPGMQGAEGSREHSDSKSSEVKDIGGGQSVSGASVEGLCQMEPAMNSDLPSAHPSRSTSHPPLEGLGISFGSPTRSPPPTQRLHTGVLDGRRGGSLGRHSIEASRGGSGGGRGGQGGGGNLLERIGR
jgi:hypothetical protein